MPELWGTARCGAEHSLLLSLSVWVLCRKALVVGDGWGLGWRDFPDFFCTSTHMLFVSWRFLFWVLSLNSTVNCLSLPFHATFTSQSFTSTFLFSACYSEMHQIMSLSRGDDSNIVLWRLPHEDGWTYVIQTLWCSGCDLLCVVMMYAVCSLPGGSQC